MRAHLLAILWGVFCACSWTWCVGMYLPGIMLERWGWPGFLAFAVPNVVGVGAFGYAMSRQGSEQLLARFPWATTVFSFVTILFHVYFGVWVLHQYVPEGGPAWGPYAWVAGLYAAGLLASRLGDAMWLGATVVTYGVSLAALLVLAPDHWNRIAEFPPADEIGLASLAMVSALGFLLCPYLDRTFHRARQRTPHRYTFLVFAGTFAVMILLSCMYVPTSGFFPRIVLVHIAVQGVFTVGAHLREVSVSPALPAAGSRAAAMLAPLIGLAIYPVMCAIVKADRIGEDTYLRFLGFYALICPAYILMFVGPGRTLPRTTKTFLVFAGVVALLSPFLEAGFVWSHAWLLVVPGVVGWGWMIVRRGSGLRT